MRFEISEQLVESIRETLPAGYDIEEAVAGILLAFASGKFIPLSDVAGIFELDTIYKKNSTQCGPVYDPITHEFKGVTVEGERPSESLFILSSELHDQLEKYQSIAVLKNPRKGGISLTEVVATFVKEARSHMA
jgi:hypothetical protein